MNHVLSLSTVCTCVFVGGWVTRVVDGVGCHGCRITAHVSVELKDHLIAHNHLTVYTFCCL